MQSNKLQPLLSQEALQVCNSFAVFQDKTKVASTQCQTPLLQLRWRLKKVNLCLLILTQMGLMISFMQNQIFLRRILRSDGFHFGLAHQMASRTRFTQYSEHRQVNVSAQTSLLLTSTAMVLLMLPSALPVGTLRNQTALVITAWSKSILVTLPGSRPNHGGIIRATKGTVLAGRSMRYLQ